MSAAQPQERIAGVDGGGTHTRAVVLQGDVEVGHATRSASNPFVVGSDAALAAIFESIDEAAGTRPLAAVGLGIAGVVAAAPLRAKLHAAVAERYATRRVAVFSDVDAALAGAFDGRPGALVIGGTGSVAIGFDGHEVVRAGGWGRRLGDEGSGYAVLREAAIRLLALRDRIEDEPTALSATLPRAIGATGLDDLVTMFAVEPAAQALADGTRAIIAAADDGDGVAAGILDAAGRALARLAVAVAKRQSLTEVVIAGGLARGSARVHAALCAALDAAGLTVAEARFTAEAGAARLGRDAGRRSAPMGALLAALGADP